MVVKYLQKQPDYVMTKYPMLLKAPLKDYIWGGDKLISEYGKETDLNLVAESWEVSCHKNGESIIENGVYKGKTLTSVLNENSDYKGDNAKKFEKFPLLIKLIDANDKLSIQVHPDDEFANDNENGEYGKTEVWYIASAKENAKLIYGFNRDIDKNEYKQAILENRLQEILNFVPVKKGDVFFIPAGLVHAICDGILICEIQQNSDTTYRVYDWGRVGADGKGRPLHIEKAVMVSRLKGEKNTGFSLKQEQIGDNKVGTISECNYFKAYKYDMNEEIVLNSGLDSFETLTFLSGSGKISMSAHEEPFKMGQTYFIPAGSGEYKIKGKCEFILSKC